MARAPIRGFAAIEFAQLEQDEGFSTIKTEASLERSPDR
jgi:hypothetical protein